MVPTLIVAHRREETTRRIAKAVLDSSGAADVWVWVDGPRDHLEAKQTTAVANMLRSQPWPGSFQILENATNLGVARAVPRAVGWVLASRPDVVVLEDDCLPSPEFFSFTHQMLDRFRDDPRIALVSGTRIAKPRSPLKDNAYAFCSFPLIWGWATWADRWNQYEHDIRSWRRSFGIRELWRQAGILHAWDWYRLFQSVATDDPWSWDYQLTYMVWRCHQVGVVPGVDLVENIGFGDLASHTNLKPSWAPLPPPEPIRQAIIEQIPVRRDGPVVPDSWLDRELRRLLFSPPPLSRFRSRLSGFTRELGSR